MAKKKKMGLQEKYNLDLAITANRILIEETHSFADCDRLVWKPTQKFLEELAKQHPKTIVCFHGPPYSLKNQPGKCIRVYLIGLNKVVYLCTVIDREQTVFTWQWFQKIYPEDAEVLKKRGPMTIVRNRMRCGVPVNCAELNRQAIEKGVELYMKSFCPSLAGLPIKWLSEREQEILEELIRQKAKRQAKPQTQKERIRIIIEDLDWAPIK